MIYLQAISALALVIGIIGLFYYLGQRINDRVIGGASKRRVQVIERTPLGDKRSLLLVRVGQQQLLLGATSNTISRLSSIEDEDSTEEPVPLEEEKQDPPTSSFRRILEAIR
jgi:flagellar protein FliO/FliZ